MAHQPQRQERGQRLSRLLRDLIPQNGNPITGFLAGDRREPLLPPWPPASAVVR